MNKKEVLKTISGMKEVVEGMVKVLDCLRAEVESEVERPFDPDKEYSFQEAVQLAVDNPGWQFSRVDLFHRVFQHLTGANGDYFKWHDRHQSFPFSPDDFKSKWKRVK